MLYVLLNLPVNNALPTLLPVRLPLNKITQTARNADRIKIILLVNVPNEMLTNEPKLLVH